MTAVVDALAAEAERHVLVGLDASGALCSCGTRSSVHLEHLADVVSAVLGEPETANRRDAVAPRTKRPDGEILADLRAEILPVKSQVQWLEAA